MEKLLTKREEVAIEKLKAAIKELPRTMYFSIDEYHGQVEFWKRTGPGRAIQAAKSLRRKGAIVL